MFREETSAFVQPSAYDRQLGTDKDEPSTPVGFPKISDTVRANDEIRKQSYDRASIVKDGTVSHIEIGLRWQTISQHHIMSMKFNMVIDDDRHRLLSDRGTIDETPDGYQCTVRKHRMVGRQP